MFIIKKMLVFALQILIVQNLFFNREKYVFLLGADHLTSEVGVGWLIWYRCKFCSNPFMHRKFGRNACVYTFFLHVHKIFFPFSALTGHLFSKSPTPSEAEWSLPYAYIRFKVM